MPKQTEQESSKYNLLSDLDTALFLVILKWEEDSHFFNGY